MLLEEGAARLKVGSLCIMPHAAHNVGHKGCQPLGRTVQQKLEDEKAAHLPHGALVTTASKLRLS